MSNSNRVFRWSGKDMPETAQVKAAMQEAGASLQLGQGAFFAFMLYQNINVRFTTEVPIAAVDGKSLLINPVRFPQLSVDERVFVIAHEIMHLILRHVARFKTHDLAGGLGGHPFSWPLANFCADYIINRILVNGNIGTYNKNWLLRPDRDAHPNTEGAVGANEAFEDVYLRELEANPPPPGGGGEGDPDEGAGDDGESSPGGKYGDKLPQQAGKVRPVNDGSGAGQQAFDQIVLPPKHEDDGSDPAQDAKAEAEMKRAVEAAKAFAKAIGTLPGALESFLDKFLEGKVDWRKLLRLTVTARTGASSRTWSRPDRRQLALRSQYWPAKAAFGCESIALIIDTSGSVSDHELRIFLGETAKILVDLKPRSVKVLWTDAAVGRVDEVTDVGTLSKIAAQRGIPGRGGTNMMAGLDYIVENFRVRPAATIILTDGYVPWPQPGAYKNLKPLWAISSPQESIKNIPENVGDFVWLDLKSYQPAE